MRKIHNYNEFINTELNEKFSLTSILDKLAFILKEMSDKRKRKEALKLGEKYKKILMDLKFSVINNKQLDSNKIIEDIKNKIDMSLIDALNLESFIRGIEFNIVKNNNINRRIDKYFDKYIRTINDRLLKYYELEPNDKYDVQSYFKDYEKVKKLDKSVISGMQFKKEKTLLEIELMKAVEWVNKTKSKILITCDGRDGSGKGSFIKIMHENSNPKVVKSSTFEIPTEEERKNWFKRYIDKFPSNGQIMMFDRSWYNRAVNDPAMEYCTKEEYLDFMKNVNGFENNLINSGIIYIKFWFMITKENQAVKFALRKTNPLKYWKYSPNDEKTVSKWDIFTKLRDQMFQKTSTSKSPWVVVDSNDKVVGQLNALRYVLSKIPYENKNEAILEPYPEVVYEII